MAKYRPKSLDELNSLYDKTVSTQTSIEATASAISAEAFPVESESSAEKIDKFFAEHNDISAGGCSDLTEDIQKFIRNFGKPATAEDEIAIRHYRPVPIKLRQLPTPPKQVEPAAQPDEAAAETQTSFTPAPDTRETKPEKTEFVITAEKNELFEEYMRIMSDEDDEADYSRSRKKRKKSKKAAEAEAPKDETADIAEKDSDTDSYTAPTYESDEEDEATESFSSFTEGKEEAIALKEENKPLSLTEDKDSPFYEDDDDDKDTEKEKQPRKNVALQFLLILLLFITLISALTVTAVQTLIKVNSGEKFMDKYYVYSAAVTDKVTDINEGDLVFIENVPTKNNEVFAYSTPDGIAYAVQTFSGEPERTSGKNGVSDNIVVLNTSIKGKVTRIYPSLGKAAAAISENFMTVIAGLLVLAIVIILLLIFAFRRTPSGGKNSQKDNLSFDDQEDFDEVSDEDFSLT